MPVRLPGPYWEILTNFALKTALKPILKRFISQFFAFAHIFSEVIDKMRNVIKFLDGVGF